MEGYDNPASSKGSYYAKASLPLRQELAETLPKDELRSLHERTPWRHFAWTGWQLLLLSGASFGLWRLSHPAGPSVAGGAIKGRAVFRVDGSGQHRHTLNEAWQVAPFSLCSSLMPGRHAKPLHPGPARKPGDGSAREAPGRLRGLPSPGRVSQLRHHCCPPPS